MQKLSRAVNEGGGYFLRGFSIDSDQAARQLVQPGVRRFRILIQRPKPGIWRISAKVATIVGNNSQVRKEDSVEIAMKGRSRKLKTPIEAIQSKVALYERTQAMEFDIPPETESSP